MTSIDRWGCCALASFFLVGTSWADNDGPQSCAAKASGLYGFQCHGSSFTGAKLEPVTFIGTVVGNESGVYEGFGTFSSSQGSASTHVVGNATFGKNCFGHIDYTTNEIEGSDLVRFQVTLPLVGGYPNLRHFIDRVETAPFLAVIDSIELAGSREGGAMLSLTIRISTYFRGPGVVKPPGAKGSAA